MKYTPDTRRKADGKGWGGFHDSTEYFRQSGRKERSWRELHAAGAADIHEGEEYPRLTHAPVIWVPRTPDYCLAYAQDVVNRDIVTGPHVRAACRRHLADHDRVWPNGPLWFDKGAYDHFALFCWKWLRFYAGQYYGRPFALEPAQEFIVGNVFGWRMWREGYPEDNPTVWPRRFRRCYLEMGKGNGKTPFMGAVALYGLLADKEPGAEIYIGASKQKQAHVCFDDAVKMARASPVYELLRVTGVSPPTRVDHLPSESFIDLLSSESKNSESGVKPHFVMLDEVHEHKDSVLIDMMQRGFKWRRQPLLIMSTNSGWGAMSAAWEEHEHGRKVSHGEIDADESFAYVCGLDAGDEPLTDTTVWVKANPLLGIAQTEEALRTAIADAKAYPARSNNILRLHFCLWTEGETAWVSKDAWEAIEHSDPVTFESIAGRDAVLAIDLSQKHDTTGLCYLVPMSYTDDGKAIYRAYCRAYLPADGIRERMDQDRRPYIEWSKAYPDLFRLTEGPTVEPEAVVADILDDLANVNCKAIVYDRFLFDQFLRVMHSMGLPEDMPVIEHPQGWNKRRSSPLSMSISIGVLERYMSTRRLQVHRNPVLRAAVAGARQLPSPSGQTRWDKTKSTTRIDVLVALTMAIGVWDVGIENLLDVVDSAKSRRDRLTSLWQGYSTLSVDDIVGVAEGT